MSQQNSRANVSATAWYVSRGGGANTSASGPFSTDMVLSMLRDGSLQSLDLVFREGETEWKPAASYRELKSGGTSSVAAKADSMATGSMPMMPQRSAQDHNPHPLDQQATDRERSISWIVLRPHGSTYLQEGPFETQTIIDGLQTGRFQFAQYAWHGGMSQWMRIGDLREFDRRTRARESQPHVPPPLPDPIAAVLLEDDADAEAEEFHIAIRGAFKPDLTPNPLESMRALEVSQWGRASVGGAAAESPEQKATHAVSLVVSTPDLASVPWEQDLSNRYPHNVDLIDDGQSLGPARHDLTPTPSFTSRTPQSMPSDTPVDHTPHPLSSPVVPGPMPVMKDMWDRWGRYAVGTSMAGIASFFAWYLLNSANLASSPEAAPLSTSQALEAAAMEDQANAVASTVVGDVSGSPVAFPVVPPLPGAPIENSVPSAAVNSAAVIPPPVANGVAPIPAQAVGSAVVPAPVPAPSVGNVNDLSVVGLKLDSPEAQVVVQGSIPANAPIQISFKGRVGQILSKISVRKQVAVTRKSGELPSVLLKDLKLPQGAYTVEADVGGSKVKNEIFVGVRNGKFLDSLEAHLRGISFETQLQKKVLFYSAQEMNTLARDLALNYGQLRAKPEQWSIFFDKWNLKISTIQRSLGELAKKDPELQAYPEEITALSLALANLISVGTQYGQAIGQKRDIAGDSLTELISELTRQKEVIGEMTSRPTADTPDGML